GHPQGRRTNGPRPNRGRHLGRLRQRPTRPRPPTNPGTKTPSRPGRRVLTHRPPTDPPPPPYPLPCPPARNHHPPVGPSVRGPHPPPPGRDHHPPQAVTPRGRPTPPPARRPVRARPPPP